MRHEDIQVADRELPLKKSGEPGRNRTFNQQIKSLRKSQVTSSAGRDCSNEYPRLLITWLIALNSALPVPQGATRRFGSVFAAFAGNDMKRLGAVLGAQ